MQPFNNPAMQTPSLNAPSAQTPSPAGYSALGNPGGTAPGLAPLAQQLQTQGRGQDSMLVHMTPGEVQGLQSLAERFGGSLSSNPTTGLPEAGFLSDILPTLLGVGMSFIPGVGPLAAAALVGGGTGLLTGDLNKGLMAGLGAFGGASLGGALGAGSVFGGGAAAGNIANLGVSEGMKAAAVTPLTSAATAAPALAQIPVGAINAATGTIGAAAPAAAAAAPAVAAAAPAIAPAIAPAAAAPSGFFQKFGAEAARGLGGGAGKASMLRTGLAATGVAMPFLSAMQPKGGGPEEEEKFNFRGVQAPPTRTVRSRDPNAPRTSSEFKWFEDANPLYDPTVRQPSLQPGGMPGSYGYQGLSGLAGYAKGGVTLDHGSFIIDARTVSELGNGSSEAGQELLARMGGKPIKGGGDGVSDSIPANIAGKQEARLARDEVQFSAEDVKRLGGGNASKGAKRLYAIMDKAHAARKSAKRGQDTGVRKHLGVQ